MSQDPQDEAEVHTLSLLEELSALSNSHWKSVFEFNSRIRRLMEQLQNPNLFDIPMELPYRIEMWDSSSEKLQWLIAAAVNVSVAHGAFDAAIKGYPNRRWCLRKGIQLLREHVPKSTI